MKYKLLLLLTTCFLYAETNKLSYDNVDLNDTSATQEKINSSYQFGINIMKKTIMNLKNKNNLDNSLLTEECNSSLYSAIFVNSIIDKFGKDKAQTQFIKDCEDYVKSLK